MPGRRWRIYERERERERERATFMPSGQKKEVLE
jgi:hypothetical protein